MINRQVDDSTATILIDHYQSLSASDGDLHEPETPISRDAKMAHIPLPVPLPVGKRESGRSGKTGCGLHILVKRESKSKRFVLVSSSSHY